jgi:hypothetical protein
MLFPSILLRRIGLAVFFGAALASATVSGQAQIRQQMADKLAVDAANMFVNKISSENCTQFASTMSQMKHGKSGSSSMSSRLKANTEARTKFVNIMAAPLLNKMISCDMLPGGM